MSEPGEVVFKYDGMEYGIVLGDLTGREMRVIKQYTDIRGLNHFAPAFLAGDSELLAITLGLAMARSGIKDVDYEALLDIKTNQIDVLDGDENPTEEDEPTGSPSSPKDTD